MNGTDVTYGTDEEAHARVSSWDGLLARRLGFGLNLSFVFAMQRGLRRVTGWKPVLREEGRRSLTQSAGFGGRDCHR